MIVKGEAVSPGLAVGTALFHEATDVDVPVLSISEEDVQGERDRLVGAMDRAQQELSDVRNAMERRVGKRDAEIFAVHGMLIDDPSFREGISQRIGEDLVNAEVAVRDEVARWVERFEGLAHTEEDRDPVADLRDVGRRLLRLLAGKPSPVAEILAQEEGGQRYILICGELLPSDTTHLDRSQLAAIVTRSGGTASHVAILARGLGIPAITGIAVESLPARGGRWVVDGNEGHVVVDPSEEDIASAELRSKDFERLREDLVVATRGPAETADGHSIELMLNVENWEELSEGAFEDLSGIGLYRTEFLFMNRTTFPSEQEQYEHYREALQRVGDRPITFRTIDVGGDKPLSYLKTPPEPNPVLGWRGIRLTLEWKDLLYTQFRALLRASAHGKVRLLLPMVTLVEEFMRAKEILIQIQDDLRQRGVSFDEEIPLGAMVEIPAVAMNCGVLAQEADFLSLGTNDLTQYALAVDRNNARVSDLYQPLHPGLLSLVRHAVDGCRLAETPLGVCGEMAGDPEAVLLLLGMGVRSFSLSPYHVPIVKRVISSVDLPRSKEVLDEVARFRTTTELRQYVRSVLLELAPDLSVWLAPQA